MPKAIAHMRLERPFDAEAEARKNGLTAFLGFEHFHDDFVCRQSFGFVENYFTHSSEIGRAHV